MRIICITARFETIVGFFQNSLTNCINLVWRLRCLHVFGFSVACGGPRYCYHRKWTISWPILDITGVCAFHVKYQLRLEPFFYSWVWHAKEISFHTAHILSQIHTNSSSPPTTLDFTGCVLDKWMFPWVDPAKKKRKKRHLSKYINLIIKHAQWSMWNP